MESRGQLYYTEHLTNLIPEKRETQVFHWENSSTSVWHEGASKHREVGRCYSNKLLCKGTRKSFAGCSTFSFFIFLIWASSCAGFHGHAPPAPEWSPGLSPILDSFISNLGRLVHWHNTKSSAALSPTSLHLLMLRHLQDPRLPTLPRAQVLQGWVGRQEPCTVAVNGVYICVTCGLGFVEFLGSHITYI